MTHLASLLYNNASAVGYRDKRHHSIRYQCTYPFSYAYVLGVGRAILFRYTDTVERVGGYILEQSV